jgi:leucyl aminopeptidase
VILRYQKGESRQPLAFVGKAVTFDAGGMNVKPGTFMQGMHMDMAGGAAVAYAMILAAKLGTPGSLVGTIVAVENMMSPTAYRPGDIITSMSGKTIEVLNTDAEGRILLADALTYTARFQPSLMIDVATLTGASIIALGQRACAIFTRHPEYEAMCRELGEKSGSYVWPLPLWDEYAEEIAGTFGDLTNIHNQHQARAAGAVLGAIFLAQFVAPEIPWVHMDIAPRLETTRDELLAKGATGDPLLLLFQIFERMNAGSNSGKSKAKPKRVRKS